MGEEGGLISVTSFGASSGGAALPLFNACSVTTQCCMLSASEALRERVRVRVKWN